WDSSARRRIRARRRFSAPCGSERPWRTARRSIPRRSARCSRSSASGAVRTSSWRLTKKKPSGRSGTWRSRISKGFSAASSERSSTTPRSRAGAVSSRLEMLQVARLAPRLLRDATELVHRFLGSQLAPGVAFVDRAGKPDLYYSVFGLECLLALQEPPPEPSIAPFVRERASDEN